MKNVLVSLLLILGLGTGDNIHEVQETDVIEQEQTLVQDLEDKIRKLVKVEEQVDAPYKMGEKVQVAFDYKDVSGKVHNNHVNLVFHDWEKVDPSVKEAPEGAQWIRGQVVLAATVEEYNEDNLAFPIDVQAVFPLEINSDFVDLAYSISRMYTPSHDVFLTTMKHGEIKTCEFEVLVPAGNVEGSTIMINTGVDRILFEL